MDKKLLKKKLSIALFAITPIASMTIAHAATPIDLAHQPSQMIQHFFMQPHATVDHSSITEMSRDVDFNKTLHIRVQQNYQGFRILGADAVLHIPKGENKKGSSLNTLSADPQSDANGVFYTSLEKDLNNTPHYALNTPQADQATQTAIRQYEKSQSAKVNATEIQSERVVFVDEQQVAHWAYRVSFFVEPIQAGVAPAKPVYIIDATTLKVYQNWDDVKTAAKSKVSGGGFGGNIKMGKLTYDGISPNLNKLDMLRDDKAAQCYLQNSEVVVKRYAKKSVMSFACKTPSAEHGGIYWNADFDAVNDGYSPGNDALYAGGVIKHLYKDWYDLSVLTKNGKPMKLEMVVHYPKYDNAYWDGSKMTFGDGYTMFYPLTSLGVAAHEVSHGFTEQEPHSQLTYSGQPGGMNEAYSDMAAQAAEVYSYGEGKNTWQIGPEIFKKAGEALRYMDQPSKDCEGKTPGNWCSIDDASQYKNGLDVHYSSGVYNHLFYFLATSEGWNVRKAFDVMVQANAHYWTSYSTFNAGACGIIRAATDHGYDVASVKSALDKVKIDYSEC